MCRGVLKLSSLPMYQSNALSSLVAMGLSSSRAQSTAVVGASAGKFGSPSLRGASESTCYHLDSMMSFNNLMQSFPNNPDSHAQGFATFKLCTNGTLVADTALVYGGQTPLIASHIHRANNGDGEKGSGPH